MANITEVSVSISKRDEHNLQGRDFTQLRQNLNTGTAGNEIFLWYKKGDRGAAITRLQVSLNEEMTMGLNDAGYEKINKNLNAGNENKPLYLWYFKGTGEYHIPIKQISITTDGADEAEKFDDGWERMACDINRGYQGKWVHIWLRRSQDTYISSVKVSDSYASDTGKFDDGYIRIDEDTNRSAGGANVFIWYRPTTDPNGALTDLEIALDGDRVNIKKRGFKIVNKNLNRKNDPVYLWYKKTNGDNPIKSMTLLLNPAARQDYESNSIIVLENDLNEGTGGLPIYLCYKN